MTSPLAACILFASCILGVAAPADLDVTFGDDGKIFTPVGSGSTTDYARCMTQQTDGKIVVAGQSLTGSDYPISVVRYNPDGSLDTDFSEDGLLGICFLSEMFGGAFMG